MEETPIWIPEPLNISSTPPCASVLNINQQKPSANFARFAKWCPDGAVIMAYTESGTFQRFDTRTPQNSAPALEFPQPAPVLDFIWYPTATIHDPSTFCFVASVRECPVKLLDASDGRLRASYKIVDHRERQIAPHSLAFNLTAQKLYCGFEDAIEVFDLSRPGEGTRMPTTPSKKTKDGLKGIVSALAFSPSYSPDESFFAAGSFTPTTHNIAMFSDAQSDPLMYLGGGPQAGVTQLRFNPLRPHILYAGYRGHASGTMYSWDVRSNVDVPVEIFRTSDPDDAKPAVRSNQKMYFDIDCAGRFLSTGDQHAHISVFDLSYNTDATSNDTHGPELDPPYGDHDTKITVPTLKYRAHEDAVSSVAFHPFRPMLLSTAGSRHFLEDAATDVASGASDEESNGAGTQRGAHRTQPITLDSSIKLWDLSV